MIDPVLVVWGVILTSPIVWLILVILAALLPLVVGVLICEVKSDVEYYQVMRSIGRW